MYHAPGEVSSPGKGGKRAGAEGKRRRPRAAEEKGLVQSTVTRPLSETLICIPSFT